MKSSLKFALEDFFLRMLRSDSRIKGMNLVHAAEEQKAKTNALIIGATVGNVNQAGPGGHDAEVIVEYRTGAKSTKTRNDLVISAVHDLHVVNHITQSVLQKMKDAAGLEFIVIRNESDSEQSSTENLRKWTMTFSVQAKLA